MDLLQVALPSRTSSVASSPNTPFQPTNDDIEAVIQMATSARPTPDGRSVPPRDTRTQLFVGNLPYRVRWQDLKDLFRRAGTVLRADVSLGPDNRSRGYGTVLLATAEEAGRAVDMFNGYSWQTRILEVRPDRLPPDLDKSLASVAAPTATALSALPTSVHGPAPLHSYRSSDDFDYGSLLNAHDVSGSSSPPSRCLFVGNLPFHCQWQDLKDLFRQAGTIIRADVALGPDGRSRGFGTVVFATELDAERAMKMFNGYEYNGRILKVHFDKFTQIGQGSSYPTSPSLHSTHVPAATLASMALNNLPSNSSTFTAAHSTQIRHHMGHQFSYGPPSGSPSPPERHQPLVPVSQRQQQILTQAFPSPAPLSTDISVITNSLNTLRLPIETMESITPPKENITSGNTSSSNSRPASRALSSSSSWESKSMTDKNVASSGNQQHPHHPGPITLPPPGPVPYPFALHKISLQSESASSVQTPVFNTQFISQQQSNPMTPHGLPPITPSMPPFTLLPPQLSPRQYPSQAHPLPDTLGNQSYSSALFSPPQIPSPPEHATSPLHHTQYGIASFSPGAAMSPGALWGRPGNPNPHINLAVGAPVHDPRPSSPSHHAYAIPSPDQQGWRGEPTGYFDPEYFPPDNLQPHHVSSSLENENLKENFEERSLDAQDGDLREPGLSAATAEVKPIDQDYPKSFVGRPSKSDAPLPSESGSLVPSLGP